MKRSPRKSSSTSFADRVQAEEPLDAADPTERFERITEEHPSAPPDADPTERFERLDLDTDPTERFARPNIGDAPPTILGVSSDGESTEISVTQPGIRYHGVSDEDLVRDEWTDEITQEYCERAHNQIPLRSDKETKGRFPHPAMGKRVKRQDVSVGKTPPLQKARRADDTEERIRSAYEKYVALCTQNSCPVVVEAEFRKRLRSRFDRLAQKYPPAMIQFRPVVEKGSVRVKVLLKGKKASKK